jgi:hypothetical protein
MKEVYRKRGAVVRWENGTLLRVNESGVAIEEGDYFECEPDARGEEPLPLEWTGVIETSQRIRALVAPPVTIERLIVTGGIAEHECNGRTWRDETQRVHLSLVRGHTRALVDREEDIARIADALARAEEEERDPPPRLRLAPNVSAALLPALVGLAPPNVDLFQSAGGIDGKGLAIGEARGAWPNWYRPTYRIRPIRMPLNLRIECEVTEIERDRPEAVALLAPLSGLTMRVLIDDGTCAYPSAVRVTRIDAVAHEAAWYPYGGGSFGAEMML